MMKKLLKNNTILDQFSSQKGQIAVLIDPDKFSNALELKKLLKKVHFAKVDYLFVGGSTVSRNTFMDVIKLIKENCSIPVVIFPGASHQISEDADALLYLSLLSGRNSDYLIGQHVLSAHEVYDMNVEIIPTAYLLIEGGTKSSVAYVSQTTPIPSDKETIIVNTAKAGILQGKKLLYLDAGSGAKNHVPKEIVNKLLELDTPIIIGGGIRTKESIEELSQANVVVIGNKIEEEIDFLLDIYQYIKARN
ncbi:MAG TPA: geranylgeranylglyceryl/heptaprenylglyceryl phosphate synthase [Crocinitomicaceae bacterium]|nr:geranylgeranylglyceryl/heptaprenylglyceryl phosphate synthase [Crocinitomicaceae bacterium]